MAHPTADPTDRSSSSGAGWFELVARPPIHLPSFDKLDPQRNDEIFLYQHLQQRPPTRPDEDQPSPSSEPPPPSSFRYRLMIIDRKPPPTPRVGHQQYHFSTATAVMLIPPGREGEYLFSTRRGLRSLARSAQTARLIAVATGRAPLPPAGRLHQVDPDDDNHPHLATASSTWAYDSAPPTDHQDIQNELAYTVSLLSRQGQFLTRHPPPHHHSTSTSSSSRRSKGAVASTPITVQHSLTYIPFMALPGIGPVQVVAQGLSSTSGPFLIEQGQVPGPEGDDDLRTVRRLYFLHHPHVIQTEVYMMTEDTSRVDVSQAAFDYHQTIVAAILAFLPESSSLSSSSEALNIPNDQNSIPMTFTPENDSAVPAAAGSDLTVATNGLIIGLGGGGLVNYWQYLNGHSHQDVEAQGRHHLTVVEIDPDMVSIAQEYFGLPPPSQIIGLPKTMAGAATGPEHVPAAAESANRTPSTLVLMIRIGDGLTVGPAPAVVPKDDAPVDAAWPDEDAATNAGSTLKVDESPPPPNMLLFPAESLDFLVIDVDAKDHTVGMSCPPAAFVEPTYLRRLYELLRPASGILAINVSARDPTMLPRVARQVAQVFPAVWVSGGCRPGEQEADDDEEDDDDVDDDQEKSLNVVVVGSRSTRALPPPEELGACIDRKLDRSSLVATVRSDLLSSLEDLVCWTDCPSASPKSDPGKNRLGPSSSKMQGSRQNKGQKKKSNSRKNGRSKKKK